MSEHDLTIRDRLEDILESIGLIEEWSQGMTELHDFMISPGKVMAFNACVMRLQVIGEHVGKLLKEQMLCIGVSLLLSILVFLSSQSENIITYDTYLRTENSTNNFLNQFKRDI